MEGMDVELIPHAQRTGLQNQATFASWWQHHKITTYLRGPRYKCKCPIVCRFTHCYEDTQPADSMEMPSAAVVPVRPRML